MIDQRDDHALKTQGSISDFSHQEQTHCSAVRGSVHALMEPVSLIAMALLGISGTGHCIGMCGPLVIAFPGRSGRIDAHLCYHAGRITTYVAVGAAMGSTSFVLAQAASMMGFDYLTAVTRVQLLFSVVAALFLFCFGLSQLGLLPPPTLLMLTDPQSIPGFRFLLPAARKNSRPATMYVTGLFMGFLPCGLSFAAFSRALAAGQPWSGGAMLLVFGLATLPGLFLIGTGAAFLARQYQMHFELFSGLLMIGMSVSLLVDAAAAVF
jgi:sulfite exporter TauE/SafE